MEGKLQCSECQTELEAEMPDGLCEACSSAALAKPVTKTPSSQQSTLHSQPRHSAPHLEELEEYFPQLEIIEQLGQGGMGVVYKARQKTLDRPVALKLLPREAGEEPGFAERFTREGQALAMLHHPNIVTVFDSGEVNGLYFFIMEFVDGPNLREVIEGGEANPAQSLKIVADVCEALQFAHEEGVVHRDIKPENILLDKKGRVKIADFGVAKLLDRKRTLHTLTSPHQIMGTPHYMAPEQTERPLEVDHRADIYSLGVVFYELLTGELPIGRFELPSEKMGADEKLDEIVLRTLAKEPDKRYQRISELQTAVRSLSDMPPELLGAVPVAEKSRAPVAAQASYPSTMFAPPQHLDLNVVYQQVRKPAGFMYFVGVSSFIVHGIPTVFLTLTLESLAGAMTTMIASAASILTIIAAQRVKRFESLQLAKIAAILCMIPITVACWMPFGLIAGLWMHSTLNKREVVAAFEIRARELSRKP